jgi:hypothetical protein
VKAGADQIEAGFDGMFFAGIFAGDDADGAMQALADFDAVD